jgi:tRNA threonylcarbamoyladenosine biosynthesis protein TsaE
MRISVKHKSDLLSVAGKILEYSDEKRIIAFYGSLGAGKTTLIKVLCKLLGTTDMVDSPSFTIVNEYLSSAGNPLYHIDLYRIIKPEEVYDLGIEEYLSSGEYCFIEWPDIIEEMLPQDSVKVRITAEKDEERTFDIF